MAKIFTTLWLTLLCFLFLGDVHAWEVPAFLRVSGGGRAWFTTVQGDLIQSDRTKIDLVNNLGVKPDSLAWEVFGNIRLENIHVLRFRVEPETLYAQSKNESLHKVRDIRAGYDLDFYMAPQMLFGANVDLDVLTIETRVKDTTVGPLQFNYNQDQTRVIPSVGLHGTFYPIVEGVALRPNVAARFSWFNYEGLESWDWEASSGVDIPINRLWTWSVSTGYRGWHTRFKRGRDTVDMRRNGLFIESAILF
jgi:hypothetical protein